MYSELFNLLVKVFLSGALGALIGVEREYSKKQHLFGVRTFLLISLWGMLSVEIGHYDPSLEYLPIASFLGLFVLTFFSFKISADTGKGGLTTFVLFPLAYMMGIMIAYDIFAPAVALAVVITAVLYAKRYSQVLINKLNEDEWSDIIRFALILFVLYPISPPAITIYNLTFNIDLFFKMIYFVSAISLVSFLLNRLYPMTSLWVVGLIGGFINSASTIYLIQSKIKEVKQSLFRVYSASQIASAIRNLTFIALFSATLLLKVWPFFFAMMLVHFIVQLFSPSPNINLKALKFNQPFTMGRAVKLAVIFLIISAVINILIGVSDAGLYAVSFIGGLFSSIAVIASLIAGAQSLSETQLAISTVCAFLGGLVATGLIGALFEQKQMRKEIAISLVVTLVIVGILAFLIL